ncbi:gamma-tubulin complex component 6 [Acipenser oxyrinchus oxyrinchus]|uniref:Gamma-tubulin complex component 6 n=1 Tax=Acipenser oxyrinchus oxyrinchus TaxID=40147 RepID=A0AAD8DGL3_ACIOX|nr:gamma-tubulin complex component 6 [Acipenser oxyrinchus oxyrinchus]
MRVWNECKELHRCLTYKVFIDPERLWGCRCCLLWLWCEETAMTSSSSITQLVSELCEPQLAGLSWKGVLGGAGRVSREALRRKLKRRAYGALLPRLFQDPPVTKPNAPLPSRGGAPPLIPARNKALMLSFNLRVSGRGGEAERLEELLGGLQGGSEMDAVLDLLVHLAGSVPPRLPATAETSSAAAAGGRRLELGATEGPELRLLEAQAWSLGEARTARRETRLSLFGALVHTRTADMDIRLDLPPVPSNAELTGLAIQVPPSLDQSEDEGFQSASNLSPDSQSEPSLTPDVDVWNAVLSYEPSQRRCWERVGCPPGKKEEPYLTEAGREAFDRLYQVREGEVRLLSTILPQTPPLQGPHSEAELVKKTLHVLIGVASDTFSLDQSALEFHVMPGVYVSGTSPDSVASLLEELAEYGTHYWRLSRFSLQPVLDSSYKKGLVFQEFTGGVRRYLHYYRACVLSTPPTLSLLTIVFLFRKLGRQLRYLSELCWCGSGTGAQGLNRGTAASFPMGVKLLSYLYNEAQNNCSNENYLVLLSLLKSSCEPYTRFIYDWVYSGVFRDVYGEFMIQVNEDYLSFRAKHFWTQGYLLILKDVEDCVPVFLRHIANEIYVSGKTINLLRVCCPRHYICWSELPVPRIAVTFSLQELEEIERDSECTGPHGEDRRYSAINREEKAFRTELARQELIVQVRETTAKALETIQGRQVSQRLAQEAKKRERFQELKQQLEVEQERRSAARQQEADSDFGFILELRDREKRLQALEEQLESQARRELIEHYSRLSEEAAARERRALWKVQRHRLETERNSFLQWQQSHIQAMLEKFPLGERREQLDIIPKGDSPRRLPAGGRGDSGEQGAQEILKPQSSDPRDHPPVLEAEPQEPEKPTPDSVQEAPGDPLPHPTGPPELGEQEPQARHESPGPLDIHDFLPKETPDLPVSTCPVVSAVDAALLDIGSELPEGTSGLQQEYDFSAPYSPLQGARLRPRWNTHQHTSQANIQLGQYASDMELSTPRASVHWHVSEANIKVGQNVSEVQVAKPVVNVHGHSSESNIQLGQYVSDMELSTPRASVHGHVSEATIQLGDESKPTVHSKTLQEITEVSEGDPDPGNSEPVLELHNQAPGVQLGEYAPVTELPGPTASVPRQASEENLTIMEKASEKELILPHVHIQGHASEEHIKLGGYVSDTEPSKPRVNIHGHASEGSIKVGEDAWDVDQVHPHLSIHGHASDSSIKVGGYVSDSEQTSPHCSVHGHASDSSIKVGGYVSDSEQTSPHCSVHGHASDSSIKVGGYMSDSEQTSSHCSVHGHASDSSIKVGGYMSDSEQTSPHCSVHGHASDSSIKVGGYVLDSEQRSSRCSVHGHTSDSSIKVGGYMSDSEQKSSHCSVHGHTSDSSIKVGEYTADEEPSRPRWSSHGHASQSHFRLGKLLSNVEPFKPCSSDALSSIPEENTEPGTGPGAENETSEWARRGEQGALAQSAVLQRGLTAEQMEDSEESLLCQGPPWGEGESWGPEWPREQAYLHSLAAQYQVEQYQDSYNLMTAAPDSHLLHQVTVAPYAFPLDPSLRRATDTTAVQLSEMVSLPVLMKHSRASASLSRRVFLVNKAIVDYYFMELNVERHCEALRHFLLMEDGEFAQSLSDLLFEKLGSGQTPGELLNPLVLNSILNKSLQYSLHGDSQLAANLTFALRFLPESFHPHAPDALACLELRYKVDWPLNIVITDSCMNKYNRIFSFLLQLKHMVWTLRDVWFHLKRAALVKGAGSSVQFRQLQLYRHEMQHFVKVIQGYIANQILHVTWSEFRTKLGSAVNLDDIHRTHADYLNRAIFRGLLTEKAAPVMNIIHSIFSLILKFRAQLISQPWSSQQGAAEHPSFGVMQQSYRTFKYYSHFLFKVVTKLVNRGYQPHLEDFLLRINFNSFYQDS